jgi:hypothetical protein
MKSQPGVTGRNRAQLLKSAIALNGDEQIKWPRVHNPYTQELKYMSQDKSRVGVWLGSQDIDEILARFKEHKVLRFINKEGVGGIPMDRRVRALKREAETHRKTRWAWIYNKVRAQTTGPVSGTHWTALIYHKTPNRFEYFDSFGNPPPKWIRDHIGETREALEQAFGSVPEVFVHREALQNDGSECGIWAIWFAVMSMRHKTLDAMKATLPLGPSGTLDKRALRRMFVMAP